MELLRGLVGVVALLAIAFLFSARKKDIDWRLVLTGISVQLVIGLLVLKVGFVQQGFAYLSSAFITVIEFSSKGAQFIFGDLTDANNFGYIFAVRVLPTIIFFSALTSGLYYLGALQKVVFGIAWVMRRALRLSGSESLGVAGNIFLGQTEAPLLVRHYIGGMNRAQLFVLMVGGMATLAGGVLASYIEFLGGTDPVQKSYFATHLLTASIMNAPAAIVFARIIIPEHPDEPPGDEHMTVSSDKLGVNFIDAVAIGAAEGLKLAAIISGMLIAFISLIYLLNYILGQAGEATGLNAWVVDSTGGKFDGFTLQYIFGQIFSPVAYICGVDWDDALMVGSLLGEKTVINEFIAYKSLSNLPEGVISEKSRIVATYALCGFSNFSSIAIQLGGLGSLAPGQRPVISRLGLRAVLGGTLACLLSAIIAGTLYSLSH